MWLVMKLERWDKLEIEQVARLVPFPIQMQAPKGEIGFCAVFTDYDTALEYAGDLSLMLEIQYREGDNVHTPVERRPT